VSPDIERRVWQCGTPVLPTFWHGRLLYFVKLYHHHGQWVTVLASQSRDGELISRTLARFGVTATRGSSSRNNVRGLLALVHKVRHGCHVCFTPDGPRGPRYTVKPGVITVAKKTGAPIVPVTYNAAWKTVLRSWDAFVIPWPFSRIVVVYGEPIYVPATASADTMAAKRQEVEASLRRITEVAEAYFATAKA
jgi:hypothetical protein